VPSYRNYVHRPRRASLAPSAGGGSSINLGDRLRDHILASSNIHLRNAIAKYGLENFVFIVVEYVEPHPDLPRDKIIDLLLEREQH